MIKRTWTYVSNNALLAAIIGGVVVLALGTWRWSDVKAFLGDGGAWFVDLGAWLIGTTSVYRVVLLADFLVLAALLAWVALWWLRGRASSAPVVAPAVRVPAGFDPTGTQVAALAVLLRNYDQTTTLAKLYENLEVLVKATGGKPFLAREMEKLASIDVVRIDEIGRTDRSYSLTMQGRDWYLDQIGDASAHPEKGPEGNPKVEPEEPVLFDPDQFELSPARCRALVELLHRVDSITTLHELHKLVTVSGANYDPFTSKGELQHDMEAAERAGLVTIEHRGEYEQRYRLAIPKGRDWVLAKQTDLRIQGNRGLRRREH